MSALDTYNQTLGDVAPTLRDPHGTFGDALPAVVGDGIEGDRCSYDPQPDGRRYAACGDGVVASVAEWIGRRLADVVAGEMEKAA